MPILHWIGKEKVINHHQEVPFKVLDQQYVFNEASSPLERKGGEAENKIIHGDNLEALKALLPEYEGKIKCIYIDPPYNTGNESWVYNDNVNHPKIKKWLGQVVGKESEDLTRHDKWLCMMYPRLKLLHKLLSDDGAIFISIDDNEQANLKLICDEVFGIGNFITDVIWRSSDNSNNDAKQFSIDHNHTIVYSKKADWLSNKLDRTEDQKSHYSNPDNDPRGEWFEGNPISSPNPRANLTYSLISPTGYEIKPPKNGWRWSKETIEEKISTNEIRFTADGKNIRRRTYLADQKGLPPSSLWIDLEITGHNRQAKYELLKIFSEKTKNETFTTPKPVKFIERVLATASDKNSIILDSFAGSGTTAHAVLNLNKQDGGNRKFILIEMEDYAESITAERVKRVINGYADKEETGGSFTYYELGQPLFIGDNSEYINEAVGIEKIRQYIWYSETRTTFAKDAASSSANQFFLGKKDATAYYFIYQKDALTTLDYETLATIDVKAGSYVLYADNCLLPKEFMLQHNIVFKKIPRDITRF